MKIAYSKKFLKQLGKASPKIQQAVKARLAMFIDDPFDPRLNNHQLQGDLAAYRSINITGDWRALFEEKENDVVYFVYLGTHSSLYG